jgi:predicted dehydrogenase
VKEVRIGIIGTGAIANYHAEQYAKMPGVTLAAACDINGGRLAAYGDKHGIEHRYADYRELLKRDDLDAVDVCLHNNLHRPLAARVLEAGFHCYCEKPMAGSYRDAAAMAETARVTGKRLHIQIATLYTPQAHCARKLIGDGRLGRPYHARSYGYRRRSRPFVDGYGEKEFNSVYWAGGGALYDMGVYHISLVHDLLGCPEVDRVSGQIYQELAMDAGRRAEGGFDVEELGCGFVKYRGGLTLDILESWAIHAGEFPPSMIAGSEGGLSIKGFAENPNDALVYYGEMSGYPYTAQIDVNREQFRRSKLDPSSGACNHSQAVWVAALRGECPWPETAKIALGAMLISEGIFLSSKLGREVTADEIANLSESNAISRQETPFGVLAY